MHRSEPLDAEWNSLHSIDFIETQTRQKLNKKELLLGEKKASLLLRKKILAYWWQFRCRRSKIFQRFLWDWMIRIDIKNRHSITFFSWFNKHSMSLEYFRLNLFDDGFCSPWNFCITHRKFVAGIFYLLGEINPKSWEFSRNSKRILLNFARKSIGSEYIIYQHFPQVFSVCMLPFPIECFQLMNDACRMIRRPASIECVNVFFSLFRIFAP